MRRKYPATLVATTSTEALAKMAQMLKWAAWPQRAWPASPAL